MNDYLKTAKISFTHLCIIKMYNATFAITYLHHRPYHYFHILIKKAIGTMIKFTFTQIINHPKTQTNTTKRGESPPPALSRARLPFPVMYRITCGNTSRGVSLSLQPRQQPQRQQGHVATVTAGAATALEAVELLHKGQASRRWSTQ